MNEPSSQRARLRKIRQIKREKRKRLPALLLDDQTDQVESDLKWMSLADQTIQQLAPITQNLKWPLLITGVCMVILSLSFIPVPTTPIQLNIKAERVGMKLAENYSQTAVCAASEVFVPVVHNLRGEQRPNYGQIEGKAQQTSFTADGKRVQVQFPGFQKGQTLAWQKQGKEVSLTVFNDTLRADFTIYDGWVVSPVFESDSLRVQPQENRNFGKKFSVRSEVKGANPVEMSWQQTEKLRLNRLVVERLTFEKPLPINLAQKDRLSTSAIVGGKLELLDTGEKFTLASGDRLILDFASAQEVKFLQIHQDSIELVFSGEVSTLKIGPMAYERSVKPSFLIFLLRNQQVSLLWTALMWLIGMGWSLKRLLIGA